MMLLRIGLIALIYTAAVVETSTVVPEAVRFYGLWLVAGLVAWNVKPAEAAAWGGIVGIVSGAIGTSEVAVEMLVVATAIWAAAWLRWRLGLQSLLAWCLHCFAVVTGLTGASLAIAADGDLVFLENIAPELIAKVIVTTLVGVVLIGLGRAARTAFAQPTNTSYRSAW